MNHNTAAMKTTMYNLEYHNGREVIEIVMQNKPLPLVRWKKKRVQHLYSGYGQLKIKKTTS